MTIGTSILLIAIIFLYLQTKDRWQWNKILKLSFLGITSISALTAIAILISNQYKEMPKIINEFQGIHLGSTKDDVMFLLGKPKEESGGRLWYGRTLVCFKEDKVTDVLYFCNENHDYKELNGIRCGDDSKQINKKFGRDLKIKKFDDNQLYRLYEINKYNCRYALVQNKVKEMSLSTLSDTANRIEPMQGHPEEEQIQKPMYTCSKEDIQAERERRRQKRLAEIDAEIISIDAELARRSQKPSREKILEEIAALEAEKDQIRAQLAQRTLQQ